MPEHGGGTRTRPTSDETMNTTDVVAVVVVRKKDTVQQNQHTSCVPTTRKTIPSSVPKIKDRTVSSKQQQQLPHPQSQKRPRPSTGKQSKRSTASLPSTGTSTSTTAAASSYIHFTTTNASDFPPLQQLSSTLPSVPVAVQQKSVSTAAAAAAAVLPVAASRNHPSTPSSKIVNDTTGSTATTATTATTQTPKFLLKKSPTAVLSSKKILQPTAREFHPLSTLTVVTSNSINPTPTLSKNACSNNNYSNNNNNGTSTTVRSTTVTSDSILSQSDFPSLIAPSKTGIPNKSKHIEQVSFPVQHPSSTMVTPSTTATSLPNKEKEKRSNKKSSALPHSLPTKQNTKTKGELSKKISKQTTPKLTTIDAKVNVNNVKQNNDHQEVLGSQFDLLRLFQNGKITNNNGVQRLTQKKKKFSSLKKKVLEERLRQWQAVNGLHSETKGIEQSQDESHRLTITTTTVCLYGFAYEIEDDDEYDEIVDNLRDMATKIGPVRYIFIPRTGTYTDDIWPAFVQFGNDDTSSNDNNSSIDNPDNDNTAIVAATAAVQCWSTLVLGGQILTCRPLPIDPCDNGDGKSNMEGNSTQTNNSKESLWRNHCLAVEATSTELVVDSTLDAMVVTEVRTEVLLDNILTDDDLHDDDCLQESLNDIRIVAATYGEVESITVVRISDSDELTTQVKVTYLCDAQDAVRELNKVVFGGQPVVATIVSTTPPNNSSDYFIVKIYNVITDDDLEDESCLEESLNDVRELATQYGDVQSITVDRPNDPTKISDCHEYTILMHFSTIKEVQDAMKGFDGMTIGGQIVTAKVEGTITDAVKSSGEDIQSTKDPVESGPMYSGSKLISERFAECKRVPKIVNPTVTPRHYAKPVNDETIKPVIIEMLSELMRLQKRAIEENNVKAKRRLVMGLREVARGIRSHKVKLVIMANNLDEYGVIDKTVQDIVDLAKTEEVPIYYELNKKGLGKSVGKSIKVAVVGVQSAEGAHQQYKKLQTYAAKNFG